MRSEDVRATGSRGEPSRRRFIAACIGAAATGATWVTGFALLVRGRHPQLFVVGDDAWQVVLVEHGSSRILILNGEFERTPEQEIDRLCSVLRQRINIVAGSRSALSLLSEGFRKRRSVDTMIQLDGVHDLPGSPSFVSLTQPLAIGAGEIDLQLRPLPGPQLVGVGAAAAAWIAHIQVGDLVLALAPSLETIAQRGRVESALALAIDGNFELLQLVMPGIAIAINAPGAERLTVVEEDIDTGIQVPHVVRIYPQDVAAFVFRDGQLVLPDWSQRIHTQNE